MSARSANVGPLTPAGRETWEAIGELAEVVPREQWAVVGGQMVAIHAAVAGVEPSRTTDDGDIVVDVRAHGRQAMQRVAAALTVAGFVTTMSPDGVTRFERRRAKIDLLSPEGIGHNVETVPPGFAVAAPGATQALRRCEDVTVNWGEGNASVRCPTLLGAIIAKAAASREIVSLSVDERLKHQQDLVFLLSLAALRDTHVMADELTAKDRARLRAATEALLADDGHRAWRAALNADDARSTCRMLLR
jgi:hypothetical protein